MARYGSIFKYPEKARPIEIPKIQRFANALATPFGASKRAHEDD